MEKKKQPEIDDLSQPDKGQAKLSFNNSYMTGSVLIVISIVSLFIGLAFEDIFFFTLFIGVAGIIILIQAFVNDAKRKKNAMDNFDVLDDKNDML